MKEALLMLGGCQNLNVKHEIVEVPVLYISREYISDFIGGS